MVLAELILTLVLLNQHLVIQLASSLKVEMVNQVMQKDHLVDQEGNLSRLQSQVVIHLQPEDRAAPMALLGHLDGHQKHALQMSMHMHNIHEEVLEYQVFFTQLVI